MTENEARHILHQSPTETAAKLVTYIGRPLARSMAKFQVKKLASMKSYHADAIAFWAEVMRHLKDGNELGPLQLSPFDRAKFESILTQLPGARG